MTRLIAVADRGQDPPLAPPWRAKALCRRFPGELHLWFPKPERGPAVAAAKEVCSRCPVRSECLEAALAIGGRQAPRGVWGGTTTGQRERIRRNRRTAAQKRAA